MIDFSPWDELAFGIRVGNLSDCSAATLNAVLTEMERSVLCVKVKPLLDTRLLHEHGFYYCDTLLTPHTSLEHFKPILHPDATLGKPINIAPMLELAQSAFSHSRFHRDFNIPPALANLRFRNWLEQLIAHDSVYELSWQGAFAGFIGYQDNRLVLHAIAEPLRGQGLAKYWWSLAGLELLNNPERTLQSSVSASNLSVMNLYASLGFRLIDACDVYHRHPTPTVQTHSHGESIL